MSFIVFDIGGTTTHLATSEDGQTLTNIERFPTPLRPAAFIKKLATYLTDKNVTGIAGGIRGILHEDKRALAHDAILGYWVDSALVDHIAALVPGVPTYLENDATMAGLGEATCGAGQGIDLVVYHDISTGVGGAKIVNGILDEASGGFEPGHQVLDIDRTILGDDVSPTLENLISGRAVAERMGMPAPEIPADDVIWDELASYLAQGLRNSILYWSPEVIVLGGAMMWGDPAIPLENVRKHTVASLDTVTDCPFITIGTLKENAGLHGALAYIQQRL